MANLYLFLDKRTARKDGACSLKLALSHKRKTAYESMDIFIRPDEWDAEKVQVTGRPDKKFLNVMIRKSFGNALVSLQRIETRHDYEDMDARQILSMAIRGGATADTAEDADYLLPVYNEYITLCRKANTAAVYRSSLNNLIEFEPDIDSLRFKDINVAWLRRYQHWLLNEKGMEINGANVYLRNLRTIFNYALQNEYTKARYPFKDIDMSTTEPDKRMIPYERFLEWLALPLKENDYRDMYRDIFMLSFYLCGIRPVDLLSVKKSQIIDGRLVYRPTKLNGKTKLSIKIEPEAWAIIKKYEGKEYLINVLEERGDYRAFCKHWNMGIKTIGRDEVYYDMETTSRKKKRVKHCGLIPYMTIYYARTCFATYLYNILDCPMDTISQALGHKSGLRVTNFYVKRDSSRVDKANRDLIDRVTKDLAEFKEKTVTA